MTDKLESALGLAAKGFRVFPLVENGKVPAIQGWPAKATTDVEQIRAWFGPDPRTGWAPDYNIGVATGHGLVVLDVDCKNGAKGFESLAALEAIHDIPESFTVTTPTGGKHVYFSTQADVRNSASALADGIDVRGFGGFVVGPGSSIGCQKYAAIAGDHAIAALPAFCEEIARRSVREAVGAGCSQAPRIELDHPDAIGRAADFLKSAEPAVEGAGGDHHTFAVAAKCKDFGVSAATALDLMLAHWNERCSPPWTPDDLERKISNAFTYGANTPGIASPAMDFEPIVDTSRRLYLEHFQDIQLDLTTRPLIENYLEQHSFSVIYGESNTGKTFVALDIAFHIATGTPWCGAATEPGGVVYVAAEGGKGIRKRIAALRKTHPAARPTLAVVPCAINLRGRNSDVDALNKLIDEAALSFGQPVALVVIDTLSRAMSGANENASEDMTAFVAAVDRIRVASGAHVMVVHHSGKDTAKGARGHSSLRAATDTEFEIADGALSVRKQRDMEYAEMKPFRLAVVDVGLAATGKVVTSCVVEWSGQGGREFEPVPLTKDEQHHLMALERALADMGGLATGGVPIGAVVAAYEALGLPAPSEKAVQRGLLSLRTKGAVLLSGSRRGAKWNVA